MIIKQKYKYSELTGKIIGCAMRVHAALESGFQEVIYQWVMALEMADTGLNFSLEHDMPVYFKNHQVGTRRVDFLMEGIVSLNMKAKANLEDLDLAQGINYLEA